MPTVYDLILLEGAPSSGTTLTVGSGLDSAVEPMDVTDTSGSGSINVGEKASLSGTSYELSGISIASVIITHDDGAGGTTTTTAKVPIFELNDGSGSPIYLLAPTDDLGDLTGISQIELVTVSLNSEAVIKPSPVDDDNNVGLACFVRGTLIETAVGQVPIENLSAGDRIATVDSGLQPLVYVARVRVVAQGSLAPIKISAGALGNTRDLWLSPQHRVLLGDWRAELLFGEPEVLVPAKHLVNDGTIRRAAGGYVSYYHLLFEHHELVWSESIPTESLHMGAGHVSDACRLEIHTLFPELLNSIRVEPAARRSLRALETSVLLA